MKNLPTFSFLVVLVFAATPSSRAQDGTLPGQLYIAGVKGVSSAQSNQRVLDLKPNTQLTAHGVVIETQAHSEDTLVLSNGAAMYVGNDSRLDVKQFQQQKFSGNSYPPQGSPSVSNSSFNIPRGFVGVCVGSLAAGSSMNFSTPLASVSVQGGMVAIQSNDNQTVVYALNKGATVKAGPDDAAGQVLSQGQQAVITRNPDGSAGSVVISPISSQQTASLMSSVSQACEAKKLVLFDSLGQGRMVTPGAKGSSSDESNASGQKSVDAQAVLPKNLPIQQTVSPDRIPSS